MIKNFMITTKDFCKIDRINRVFSKLSSKSAGIGQIWDPPRSRFPGPPGKPPPGPRIPAPRRAQKTHQNLTEKYIY